eukprot:gene9596-9673_t
MIKKLLVFFTFALVGPALADDFASDWIVGLKSRARLISAGEGPAGHFRAGLQVELAKNTITYWRNPGEAGLPPQFSFAGSENVLSAKMDFPAPKKLSEGGIAANGYDQNMIFPLEIIAAIPALPVRLNYSFDYAVCEKICIPAKASGTMVLSKQSGPYGEAIAQALAQVPKIQPFADAADLSILSVKQSEPGVNPSFIIAARAPAGQADLFVEVPEALFATVESMPPEASGQIRSFKLRFDAVPTQTDILQQSVRLTLVSGGAAIDTTIRLDGTAAKP